MKYDPDVHSLLCPKCGHGMTEVTWGKHEEITIDRCTHCKGMWFDTNEAQQLKRKPESEVLDEGNPEKAAHGIVTWTSTARAVVKRC